MNVEWELSAYLAEAVELLKRVPKADQGMLSEKISIFLKRYKEEFQSDQCN